jgi:para-nitrobenzyl esterase
VRDGGNHGEFDAFEFGDVCVQFRHSGVHYLAPHSENCLTLNVWRPPVPRNATAASALPILVFLHGGAFVTGGTAQRMFDGAEMAMAANAIVVTVNYRLGPLGFVALPALTLRNHTVTKE